MTLRNDCYQRLRNVREELDATAFALGRAVIKWDTEAGTPAAGYRGNVTLRQLQAARSKLDDTYLLRMVADFEGILRNYWENGLNRGSSPKMSILIARVAAKTPTPISDSVRDKVHHVREFRNSKVHTPTVPIDPLTFGECLSRISTYISYFPQQW